MGTALVRWCNVTLKVAGLMDGLRGDFYLVVCRGYRRVGGYWLDGRRSHLSTWLLILFTRTRHVVYLWACQASRRIWGDAADMFVYLTNSVLQIRTPPSYMHVTMQVSRHDWSCGLGERSV